LLKEKHKKQAMLVFNEQYKESIEKLTGKEAYFPSDKSKVNIVKSEMDVLGLAVSIIVFLFAFFTLYEYLSIKEVSFENLFPIKEDQRKLKPEWKKRPCVTKKLLPEHFKIDEDSLKQLRLKGISEKILMKLENIKYQKIIGVKEFLKTLTETIGKEKNDIYKLIFDEAILIDRELNNIIENHEKWLATNGREGRMANLSNYTLKNCNLSGRNLSESNLRCVDLRDANLSRTILNKADITNADLSGAILRYANLNGATINNADLSNADLYMAKLRKASLYSAILNNACMKKTDLSEAVLEKAVLRDAKLIESNLNGANLIGVFLGGSYLSEANVSRANMDKANLENINLFEPDPSSIQDFNFIGVKGLSKIKFNNPISVIELRKVARDSSARTEERALTSALIKYQLIRANLQEKIFKQCILLGYITDFGAKPFCTIYMLLILIVTFAMPYTLFIKIPSKDGIWKVWSEDRIRTDLGKEKKEKLTYRGYKKTCLWGLYFSVLSAFHIGWRELDIGNWIARISHREYTLKASGLARMVSGIQSLISIYLLASWLITYFGRPFD